MPAQSENLICSVEIYCHSIRYIVLNCEDKITLL